MDSPYKSHFGYHVHRRPFGIYPRLPSLGSVPPQPARYPLVALARATVQKKEKILDRKRSRCTDDAHKAFVRSAGPTGGRQSSDRRPCPLGDQVHHGSVGLILTHTQAQHRIRYRASGCRVFHLKHSCATNSHYICRLTIHENSGVSRRLFCVLAVDQAINRSDVTAFASS